MRAKAILLIAEKDKNSFELMKKELRDAGCNCSMVHFTSGRALMDFLAIAELAEYIELDKFAILIDTDLYEIDGMKALKLIKKNKNLKNLPIIMMMENEDAVAISTGYSLGCGGFIYKPIEVEKLFSLFDKLNVTLVDKDVRDIVV